MKQSSDLGEKKISKILIKLAIPSSIGFLVMSIYHIVDTIFVGQWVGTTAIAAITVVIPISFFISSIGMAIGVGGASIISRALGSKDKEKALLAFGNQTTLTIGLSITLVILGFILTDKILILFGGKGEILAPAREYFRIILLGVPFLAWAMMTNNVLRAEGKASTSMVVMSIPAVLNIILDPIFIYYLDMGLAGAAWATTISYIFCAAFTSWIFLSGKSELYFKPQFFRIKKKIVKEIGSLGVITLARQGSISLLSLVLNNTLFSLGGEISVAIYGIINRVIMFAMFPIIGITMGFLPIAGFNYGAKNYIRVKEAIRKSFLYGSILASFLFLLIVIFSGDVVSVFSNDKTVLEHTPRALIIVFLATPIIIIHSVGSGYFQAAGKAVPALLLTLTRQFFFLIPLVIILPIFFGLEGIWYSFPIADILSTAITWVYLSRQLKKLH
ncbi:MATE family efflux transporter [Bacteroidota bacterium]